MNKANQLRALVVGTGDLSEIALGWNTFNGDHMSHYNVNAGVPKTLVRHLVGWVAAQPRSRARARSSTTSSTRRSLRSCCRAASRARCFQQTEEIIGPYELHDFFLYHFARWESRPAKIQVLAEHAFEGRYDAATIRKWLRLFVTRFFAQPVEAVGDARRPQGGVGGALAAGRLAHAVGRRGRVVAARPRLSLQEEHLATVD